MSFLLGLDVSTSCTGYAIFDIATEDLIETGHLDMKNKKKYPTFYSKCFGMKEEIRYIDDNFAISKIFIETPLKSFQSGFSSANTLSMLSKFNGVVSWLCYEKFKIEPEHIEARSARALNGIKTPKGSNVKQIILDHVLATQSSFSVNYTKAGNVQSYFYDIADAIIIAKAGILKYKS